MKQNKKQDKNKVKILKSKNIQVKFFFPDQEVKSSVSVSVLELTHYQEKEINKSKTS